jgi:DNA-binding transcriptional LysR family regulator
LRSLPPLNSLRAFEAAARHLSFTRAAEELRITPAAISHQVKSLEQRLGVQLFRRLPRALRLTIDGQALYPELSTAFDLIGRAIEHVKTPTAHGRLVVSTTPTFALSWLVSRLQRFHERHAQVEITLVTTVQLVSFEREDVDVAIRYGRGDWSGLQADKLFDDELTPLCGRRYVRKFSQPGDLLHAPLLTISGQDHWGTWLRAAGLPHVSRPNGGPSFDSMRVGIDAAVAGAGIAIGDPRLHAELLADGRLIQLFDIVVPSGASYWFVCPEGIADDWRVRLFRQWLLDETKGLRDIQTRPSIPTSSQIP